MLVEIRLIFVRTSSRNVKVCFVIKSVGRRKKSLKQRETQVSTVSSAEFGWNVLGTAKCLDHAFMPLHLSNSFTSNRPDRVDACSVAFLFCRNHKDRLSFSSKKVKGKKEW